MYASTLDSVRSRICNVGPPARWRLSRDDGDYVESGELASSDSRAKNWLLHSYST
jgi:hypothetical protein